MPWQGVLGADNVARLQVPPVLQASDDKHDPHALALYLSGVLSHPNKLKSVSTSTSPSTTSNPRAAKPPSVKGETSPVSSDKVVISKEVRYGKLKTNCLVSLAFG